MLPGTLARRYAPGSAPTIARSGSNTRACASWPASCRARVLGSIALSPTGCTASVLSLSPPASSLLTKWPSGSVLTLAATMNLISLLPKRLPDSALALGRCDVEPLAEEDGIIECPADQG